MRATVLCLLLPATISIAPWIGGLAAFRFMSDSEGAIASAALLGFSSFVLTGPLTGLTLSGAVRSGKFKLWTVVALVLLVGSPTIAFQLWAYSSSVLPAFTLGGPYTVNEMLRYYVQAIPLAIAAYFIYALVSYWQARYGLTRSIITTVMLPVVSVAALAIRLGLFQTRL